MAGLFLFWNANKSALAYFFKAVCVLSSARLSLINSFKSNASLAVSCDVDAFKF